MRVLVHEYASGSGTALPRPIVAEGCAMRDALCADLAAVPGIELLASAAPALPPPSRGKRVTPRANERDTDFLLRAARGTDAVWLVAPESAGIALYHTRTLEGAGIPVLGCTSAAVELASSKSRTLTRLTEAGIRAAPTWPLASAPLARHAEWAVKLDRGCGCEEARRLTASQAEAQRRKEETEGRIAQPWLAGLALSLSLRIAGGRADLLSVNRQHIAVAADGALSLQGITHCIALPAPTDVAALARRIAAAIPGLRGFVGVDFVLGIDGRATVLEVNPRLTSAYVGLSARLGRNLAAEILADFTTEDCHA